MSALQIIAIAIAAAVTVVAVAMTTAAVRSIVSTLKIGGPALQRTDEPVRRTITMVKETFLHTRMLQWHWVGIMHWFVYAAFLLLSTAVLTGYFQLFDPHFVLPIIGHFFLYEWASEGLGLLGTIGIVFLIVYRQLNRPSKEGRGSRFYGSRAWQAYFVEAMALLEGSAILFIRGAEYNLLKLQGSDYADRFHFPLASWVGEALFPTAAGSEQTLENIIVTIALIKVLLAMVWLIVISANLTMGIAWHRFTAWPNIWFKRDASGRTALGALKPLVSDGKPVTLDDIDDLDEDSTLGVGKIEDFGWKGILDFTTCTECGRCQSQCPAWNTEKPLSPKLLIMNLREHAYAKAPYSKAGGEGSEAALALLEGNEALAREAERPLVGDTGDDWFYMPENGAAVIDEDVLWSCTSCGACVQQCPVDIEHVDHIVDMRRYQVLVESNFPAELNGLFKGLENKGNPWNMSASARMDWAKGLDFEVPVVGETIESLDEVDWLFWVGCAGAYEDRAKKTTRATAELLNIAGISFGVLGNGETCTGDSARRAGNEFVFQGLAQQNVETLKEYKAKKVVSTCPHCMNTLKNEYKEFGIELEVIHHTQLLNRLVRDGKLTPVAQGAGAHERKITYHDPCYLGRHNQVYAPPRELLQIMPGAEVKEMERNSERSFCCGAGGARMWMEETIGERINVNRTQEAVGTGADQIAVGCPFCRVMLSDGLTSEQANGAAREEVEVLDVAQMLLASVKGEQATKLLPGEGADLAAEAEAKAAAKAEKAAQAKSATPVEEQTAENPEEPTEPARKPAADLFSDAPAAEPKQSAKPADDLFSDAPKAAPATTTATQSEDLFGDASASESTSTPKPATPPAAKAGGDDLFGADLFDTPAKPAAKPAAKPNEPAAESAGSSGSTAPKPATSVGDDLFASGDLFDTPAAATKPTPPTKPAPPADAGSGEPSQSATSEPAEPAEPSAAKPTTDIGDDLFGIAAPAPAAAASTAATGTDAAQEAAPGGENPPSDAGVETPPAEASDPADATEQASSEPATKPATEIGDDLFGIAAPAPAATAPPSGGAADTTASADEPSDTATASRPADEPRETPTSPAASSPSPRPAPPAAKIGDDLFAIAGPETETETAPAPEPETAPATATAPDSEPSEVTEPSTEPESDPAADAATEAADRAATSPASPARSASRPTARIPESGNLFDIAAPEPAASTPDDTDDTDDTTSTDVADDATSTDGPSVDQDSAGEEHAEEDGAEDVSDDAVSDDAGEATDAPKAAAEADEPTPPADKPAPSGARNTPRTDADIHGADSLFDI